MHSLASLTIHSELSKTKDNIWEKFVLKSGRSYTEKGGINIIMLQWNFIITYNVLVYIIIEIIWIIH